MPAVMIDLSGIATLEASLQEPFAKWSLPISVTSTIVRSYCCPDTWVAGHFAILRSRLARCSRYEQSVFDTRCDDLGPRPFVTL